MYFDRFDIAEAHYVFAHRYHNGQGCRLYERLGRIARYSRNLKTRPEDLSENGREIFRRLVMNERRRRYEAGERWRAKR